jgi:hypothetical protein
MGSGSCPHRRQPPEFRNLDADDRAEILLFKDSLTVGWGIEPQAPIVLELDDHVRIADLVRYPRLLEELVQRSRAKIRELEDTCRAVLPSECFYVERLKLLREQEQAFVRTLDVAKEVNRGGVR